MQEKFSASDNPMALRVKKVSVKKTDRGFYAKNGGVDFDKLWLVTALSRCKTVAGPGLLGHVQVIYYRAVAVLMAIHYIARIRSIRSDRSVR